MSGGLHTNRGAKRGREARAALGLDGVQPCRCLLELVEDRLAIPVVFAPLGEGLSGWCWRPPGAEPVIWVNGTHVRPRQRFTLAHELGHLRCGHDAALIIDTPATMFDAHDPLEVQANAFAAELLMPRDGVLELVEGEPSLDDAARVAAHFGVSCLAVVHRFRRLELTTRHEQLVEEAMDLELVGRVWERLELPAGYDDAIERIDTLPRWSPALDRMMLAAVAAGDATVGDAAVVAGLAAERLSTRLGDLGL